MKRTTTLSVILFIAALLLSMNAQLARPSDPKPSTTAYVTWAVKPGVYDKIESCADNLYSVYKGNKVGIVDGHGREIVPVQADRITGFYDGLALVLQKDGSAERVLGVLTPSGQYTKMDVVCHAIPTLEFFSEGLLPVKFNNGRLGYVNAQGVAVKEFDKSITSLLPFSEGYAAIGDKFIVDRSFRPITMNLKAGVTVRAIYNVHNGKAVIYDGDLKTYVLDVRTGSAPLERVSNETSDFLGCINTGRSQTIPYESYRPQVLTSIVAIQQNGKYGYYGGGQTLVPVQFDEAEPFIGNNAVVKSGGKYALLELHKDGAAFGATPDDNGSISYRRSKSKGLSHRFRLDTPSDVGDAVQVNVVRNGVTIPATASMDRYEFRADASQGRQEYLVEVSANGLKMWEGSMTYSYNAKSEEVVVPPPDGPGGITEEKKEKTLPLRVSIDVENKMADKDNKCYIKVTVENPNNKAVTTQVTVKGSSGLKRVSEKVTIAAKQSKVFRTYFTIKKTVIMDGWVTATESLTGKSASKTNLELKPKK